MKSKTVILFFLTLVLLLFIALNANRYFVRIDVTKSKIYTISKESKDILNKLDENVYITYYVSETLIKDRVEAQAIEDILTEFDNSSKKIGLQVVRLKSDDKKINELNSMGLKGVQYNIVGKNEQSVQMVYSGIEINYLGKREVIPFTMDDGSLEYQVTSIVASITSNDSRKLGIMSLSKYIDFDQDMGYLLDKLNTTIKIVKVEPGQTIPNDIKVLYVIGGDLLSGKNLYYIDQFIMEGKSVFFALDGVNINPYGSEVEQINNPDLFDYLKSFGIELNKKMVLDDYNQVILLSGQLFKYPAWIILTPEQANKDNPLTRRFSGLDLFWASSFNILNKDDKNLEILLSSSNKSWLSAETQSINPALMNFAEKKSEIKPYPVNVFFKGKLDSYFKDKDIKIEGENTEARKKSTDMAKVMFLSNSDFLRQSLLRNEYNIEYFLNSFEYLSANDQLLKIKTKSSRFDNLKAIDPSKKARIGGFSRVLNLYVIPLALLIFSIYVYFANRKSEGGR